MDRHEALHLYCRVIECGSFAAAARDLDLARSVVTRTIQELEAWTGSRLLRRTTRAMQPTAAGERFHAYCQRVLRDTATTLAELQGGEMALQGRLAVSAPVSLTLAFLHAPLLAFAAAHPDLTLDVRLSDRPVDLLREGVDVALRGRAALEDSSLVALPLTTLRRVVVASPAYWNRHGRPDHPADLARHACLPYLLGTDAHRWTFTGPDGVCSVDVQGRLRSDNSLLLVEALRAGLGVGLVPELLVQRALADGELEAGLSGWGVEPRTLHAVVASRHDMPARVRALIAFLRERLAPVGD